MDLDLIRERLTEEAITLASMMGITPLRGALESYNNGYYMEICPFEMKSRIELWLDHSSHHKIPIFWCGLTFDRRSDLEVFAAKFLARTPHVERIKAITSALPSNQMDSHLIETPHQTSNHIGCYFTVYSSDRAIAYLETLLPAEQMRITFSEGDPYVCMGTRYERSQKARQCCIEKNGLICCVCQMQFEHVYGDLGKGYIHVHHVVPLHTPGRPKETDSEKLVCVCPNCHAMLHAKYLKSPERLKELMKNRIAPKNC